MWKVAVVLQAVIAVAFSLGYGPCHKVKTVNFNQQDWNGQQLYVNVKTKDAADSCMQVTRSLNGDQIHEVFKRYNSGTPVESTVDGTKAGPGHYTFSKPFNGKTVNFNAYFMHFEKTRLDCHYVCTDDDAFKSGHGSIFCETPYPVPPKSVACDIKKTAEANGFSVNDLMIVDNCNCKNFATPANCKTPTVAEFFAGC